MSIELVIILVLSAMLGLLSLGYVLTWLELGNLKKHHSEANSQAKERSLQMIEDAKRRAMAIISEARVHSEELRNVTDEKLKQVTEQQLRKYEETLASVSKNVEEEYTNQIGEFKTTLKMETVDLQKSVAQKLELDYARAKQEVTEWESQQKTKLVKAIPEIAREVIRSTIGKSLTIRDQEELVTAGLEEALKAYGNNART